MKKDEFKKWYKIVKKLPFERVYEVTYESISVSLAKRGIVDASFEIHVMMLFVTAYVQTIEISTHRLYQRLFDMQHLLIEDLDEEEHEKRFKLYCDVTGRSVKLRGDAIIDRGLDGADILIKSIALFVDLACLKSYRSDYENAPKQTLSLQLRQEYTAMFVREITLSVMWWVRYLLKYVEDGLTR